MPLGGVSTDRSVWMVEVKCTHPHAQVSSHQWCCLRIFPSSCKNSAVFGESNALVSLMQSRACVLRREVKHLWRGSVDALLTISAPVHLNQAVTWRNRRTTCAPTRETQMGTCRLVRLLSLCSCKCSSWQLCGWRNVFRKTPAFRGFIYLLIHRYSISNACFHSFNSSRIQTNSPYLCLKINWGVWAKRKYLKKYSNPKTKVLPSNISLRSSTRVMSLRCN